MKRLLQLFSIALIAIPLQAWAQTTPPTVTFTTPSGIQRGATATFVVEGTGLEGAKTLVFSEPGLSGKVLEVSPVPTSMSALEPKIVRSSRPYFDKMATPIGKSLGVPEKQIMMALVVTQIVGVPCALAFGAIAKRVGAKTGIMIGLGAYALICGFAAFMKESWHFWALAIAVGLVQGGTQALSRSIFASMIPKGQSGEFFGFFSTMEKFAGIAGPLLLGLIWAEGGDPRTGIVALAVFFIVGMILLAKVDVDEGRRAAAGAAA